MRCFVELKRLCYVLSHVRCFNRRRLQNASFVQVPWLLPTLPTLPTVHLPACWWLRRKPSSSDSHPKPTWELTPMCLRIPRLLDLFHIYLLTSVYSVMTIDQSFLILHCALIYAYIIWWFCLYYTGLISSDFLIFLGKDNIYF